MPMICQALAPLAFGRNEQLWNGSLWPETVIPG
jgi:hypothetical protein